MREPPHRHAGAQHEQAHLRQYHPCNRERIHTSSNDRNGGVAVTNLMLADGQALLLVISSEVEKSLEVISPAAN
jgi:hypothetical protein